LQTNVIGNQLASDLRLPGRTPTRRRRGEWLLHVANEVTTPIPSREAHQNNSLTLTCETSRWELCPGPGPPSGFLRKCDLGVGSFQITSDGDDAVINGLTAPRPFLAECVPETPENVSRHVSERPMVSLVVDVQFSVIFLCSRSALLRLSALDDAGSREPEMVLSSFRSGTGVKIDNLFNLQFGHSHLCLQTALGATGPLPKTGLAGEHQYAGRLYHSLSAA
jgi:hypothetical protein